MLEKKGEVPLIHILSLSSVLAIRFLSGIVSDKKKPIGLLDYKISGTIHVIMINLHWNFLYLISLQISDTMIAWFESKEWLLM